jgi:Amiloride-sensitive sodium channel
MRDIILSEFKSDLITRNIIFPFNSCKWMGENCSSDIIQPVDTSMGRCYTFNGRSEKFYNASATGLHTLA